MHTGIALDVTGLSLRRGSKLLFKDLALHVKAGQLLILRGSNGSGKTSLLRTLAGLSEAAQGEVVWRPLNDGAPLENFHQHIAYAAHHPALHPAFTALENLHLGLGLQQADGAADIAHITALFKQLQLPRHLPVARLSQGQQRRLALLQVQLAQRPAWLLDEPLTALDEAGIAWFRRMLADHLAVGGLCIMSLHQSFDWSAAQLQTLQLDAGNEMPLHARSETFAGAL